MDDTLAREGVLHDGGTTPITANAGTGGAASAGGAVVDAGDAVMDAGVVIDGGPVAVGPRPTCGGSYPDADNACASLQHLEFSNPDFVWVYGGGGEVSVAITNAGADIVPYPCFGLTVDQPTVNLPTMLEPTGYVMQPAESGRYTFPITFAGPVAPGTLVHFTVWVDSLNRDCTDGGEFAFALTVN